MHKSLGCQSLVPKGPWNGQKPQTTYSYSEPHTYLMRTISLLLWSVKFALLF